MACPLFAVATDHPVALASKDHTDPWGAMHDNSRHEPFNLKLFELVQGRPLYVLDLGCSGGGFVKDCIDAGHQAVGIEGSDYSKLRSRAEWATIPGNLFTADITRPFQVLADDKPARFHAITAWEVIEHIAEADLPAVFANVRRHLAPGGRWIMSVSPQSDPWHQTVQPREWWADVLERAGFVNSAADVEYFGDDWVRGPKQWAPYSFHFVLKARG